MIFVLRWEVPSVPSGLNSVVKRLLSLRTTKRTPPLNTTLKVSCNNMIRPKQENIIKRTFNVLYI